MRRTKEKNKPLPELPRYSAAAIFAQGGRTGDGNREEPRSPNKRPRRLSEASRRWSRGGCGAQLRAQASGQEEERVRRRRVPSEDKVFICSFPDCVATFNRPFKLKAHLLRHMGQEQERPFICTYEGCGKGFTRDAHLKRHYLIHTGEKPYECTVPGCNEKFITKANLNKHVIRRHLQRKYVCEFENCGKAFKKHQQLKVHESQHTGEPIFKCTHEDCGKHFATPAHLKRHGKTHEGYPCRKGDCPYVGKTWSELLKHMRYSHTEPVICKICSKEFTRKDYLRSHQKIHAANREVLKCPRENCERTYTTVFNLKSHILSFHEARRPFRCDHPGCGRDFAMKQSLIRHTVIHDPEKRNAKVKKPRPRRSLASHLSGYIPLKSDQRDILSISDSLTEPAMNTVLAVETLSLG
nr:PREDICTED: transcription factor IIIA [Anolis carolinensis]|eukprot:XP_008116091.1 PREDICTED: transcription factor IIIA [Anolis carolinensis]